MTTQNDQLVEWINKLEDNVDNFLSSRVTTKGKRLTFIRSQYTLVATTLKLMDGKAYLVGAVHRKKVGT
jgi:hypothetical protein